MTKKRTIHSPIHRVDHEPTNCPYDEKEIAEFNRRHDIKYGFDVKTSRYNRREPIPVFLGRPDFSEALTIHECDKAVWAAHFEALEKHL